MPSNCRASAAVAGRTTVEAASVADWRAQLELNVVVPAELTRLLLPALRAARGKVVFLNSGSGLNARAGDAVYAASKFALRALADSQPRFIDIPESDTYFYDGTFRSTNPAHDDATFLVRMRKAADRYVLVSFTLE